MNRLFIWVIVVLMVISEFVLVWRNIIINKEIKTLRTDCYLLTVWDRTITDSLEHTLATIQTMRKDIEELKRKAKTFYY